MTRLPDISIYFQPHRRGCSTECFCCPGRRWDGISPKERSFLLEVFTLYPCDYSNTWIIESFLNQLSVLKSNYYKWPLFSKCKVFPQDRQELAPTLICGNQLGVVDDWGAWLPLEEMLCCCLYWAVDFSVIFFDSGMNSDWAKTMSAKLCWVQRVALSLEGLL